MVVFQNKGAMAATIVVAASDSLNKAAANYVCDGVADNVEIQAAIDALPAGGGKVHLTEGTFVMAAGSGDTPLIRIVNDNIILKGSGWGTILDFTAHASTSAITVGKVSPLGIPTLTTSNLSSINNKTIPVADASGIAAGDLIKLYSDDPWISAAIGTLGELCEVASVVGNTITTKIPIYGGTIISATAYTTANSAAVVKIDPVKNTTIRDLRIIGNRSQNNAIGICLEYAVDSKVENVYIQDTIYVGVGALHSLRTSVSNSRFDGINQAGLGYSVVLSNSSRDMYVTNNYFTNGRHATDLGGSAVIPGVPRNLVVSNNYAENMIAACYSTHLLGDLVRYENNTAVSPADYGFSIGTLRASVIGNTVTGFTSGDNIGIIVTGGSWGTEKGSVVISGNTIEGWALYSINVYKANGVTISQNTCGAGRSNVGRIEINLSSGVSVVGNRSHGLSGFSPFIRVVDSSYVSIVGNSGEELMGGGQAGIAIISSTVAMSNIIIGSNTLRNYGRNFDGVIKVEEGGGFAISDVTISGNILFSANVNSYALLITKTGSNYIITDNNLTNVTAAAKVNLTGIDATDIIRNNNGYVTENSGSATFSGDGAEVAFVFAHGLAATPTHVVISAKTDDAAGDWKWSAGAADVTITFMSAPAIGVSNVIFSWEAKV